MNSLTTVGGKVIESEELNEMHDRLSRFGSITAKNNSVSDRMNSPRSQLKKASMRRTTSSGNDSPIARTKLSRRDSAPPAIDNDEPPHISTRSSTLQLPPKSPTFQKKVSTPSTSYSSAAATDAVQQKHHNSRVIDLLEKLSQQESFNKSSYFRGVFTRGIEKVKQCTNRIDTIEEALELCFVVSDDMKKVIAAKIHADSTMSTMMSPIVGSNGIDTMQGTDLVSNNNISSTTNSNNSNRALKPWESFPLSNNSIDTMQGTDLVSNNNISSTTNSSNSNRSWKPWESSPRSNNRKSKPWEQGGTSTNRRPSIQEYMQQIEARIHLTYSDGNPRKDKLEDTSSVFRANAALDIAVDNERMGRSPFDEALVSPRLISRKGMSRNETMSFVDEALVSPRFVRRKGMEEKELKAPREAETKAELFSGSEHLVKELELVEDNKRMSLKLVQNNDTISRQKEEIDAFKVAFAEAEMVVQMLEESVRELKKDTKAKDVLISQLESKVKEQDIVSAGNQMAHHEQVKELGSAVAQLNMLVKDLETKSKETNSSLEEAVQKYNKSEEALKELKLTMDKKGKEHATVRDDLAKELEACKERLTSSLDDTKQQMNGIIKEKDSLIYSLSAKIEILESNLEDMREMKLQMDISTANKEKELNEKIHALATTLTEKDEEVTGLEKQIQELKLLTKKEHRSERHQRHHSKPRPWEHQDIDSLSRRSSFDSREERSRRQYGKSSHKRRSHDDDVRTSRSHKTDRVSTRVRYSTPEPYYEDERDDGYGYGYPERDASLLSPIDDDSYAYRRT